MSYYIIFFKRVFLIVEGMLLFKKKGLNNVFLIEMGYYIMIMFYFFEFKYK